MSELHTEALWRDFPKTLLAFEERFSSEQACRDYLAGVRWNGSYPQMLVMRDFRRRFGFHL